MTLMKDKIIRLIPVRLFCGFVFATVTMFFLALPPVHADSPVVTIGHWDGNYQCPGYIQKGHVYAVSGPYDIDTFTRDSLVGEVFSFWHEEALKANKVID